MSTALPFIRGDSNSDNEKFQRVFREATPLTKIVQLVGSTQYIAETDPTVSPSAGTADPVWRMSRLTNSGGVQKLSYAKQDARFVHKATELLTISYE